jgi:hypothetical protein
MPAYRSSAYTISINLLIAGTTQIMTAGEGQTGDRVFEVSIPPNATEAVVALQGLKLQFAGLGIHERVNSPSRPINDATLMDASNELWGNPIYGSFATSYVDTLKRDATNTIRQRDGKLCFWKHGGAHFDLPSSYGSLGDVPEGEVLDDFLTDTLDNSALPFRMAIRRPTGRYHPSITALREVVPGQLTTARLARYLHHNGLHEHTPHGTLGKALDVLLHAAGVEIPGRETRVWDDDYVSRDDLMQMMASTTDLTVSQRYGVLDALELALRGQLWGGHADQHGEVVAEGLCSVGAIRNRLTWSSVAVSSVGQSVVRRPKAGARVQEFLTSFTERYAEHKRTTG